MKKIYSAILLCCFLQMAIAQDDVFIRSSKERAAKEGLDTRGFKPERMFYGAAFNLGFSAGGWGGTNFNIGANPEIGYSFTKWFDAGVSFNLNYFSYRLSDFSGDYKQNSFNYGAGVFARIYPIQELFITALPEYNFINSRVQFENNGPNFKIKEQAFSMLAGIGYGRRFIGESGFYTAIMFDLANSPSSPYITTGPTGDLMKLPIFRAGFTMYLKPKSQK
jgi:hypothetical protein